MEQEKKPFYKKWWVITIAIFFGIGFIGDLFSEQSISPQPVTNAVTEPTQAKTSTQTATSQKVSVGEEGYINAPSPKAVIALTKDGVNEISKIYLANDMMGVGDFLLSGKGFAVTKGTKVLVTESAVGSRKVRILEGDQIGNTGWIVMEWVTKTK